MNLSFLNWQAGPSRDQPNHDDGANDWLGGEAWVTPQTIVIDTIASPRAACSEDPANDWVPL
ncbi:MAG TPA: hypothetical protein VFN25_07160 [Dokdonella sp.]|uniref:hypothetical protein n=1 Tax=Dokdonella sp. TaxID=2291710 RepID=UPI002D80EE1F|nr:hypothetical protein [Dokdonella sp.]HET9032668.1 hypothetical protein [Dokdonella sp.]